MDTSSMISVERDGKIERFDKHMPAKYWQRTKKQTVDYVRETPFATERQLEDQRLLIEKNRNPQLHVHTKLDKLKIYQAARATGTGARAVAVKAHVLNKIVRDASGVNSYTMVAPPKIITGEDKVEKMEPETNPKVRPYVKEAKMKPVLCSFGHRPRSASRTFHPATMKFRLKHGEIAKAEDPNTTGFGLPVHVLGKILKSDKLHHTDEPLDSEGNPLSPNAGQQQNLEEESKKDDYFDLFFAPEVEAVMFAKGNPRKIGTDEGSQASWVSSTERSKLSRRRKMLTKLQPLEQDPRPVWDEAHHRTSQTQTVFDLRKSGLNDNKQLPIKEKLTRFSKLAAGNSQLLLFCQEKQQTDNKLMAGEEHHVPKATPVLPGRPLYYCPFDENVQEVQCNYRMKEAEKARKRAAKKYKEEWKDLPRQGYFPTTRLARFRATQPLRVEAEASSITLDAPLDGSSSLVDSTNSSAAGGEGTGGIDQVELGNSSSRNGSQPKSQRRHQQQKHSKHHPRQKPKTKGHLATSSTHSSTGMHSASATSAYDSSSSVLDDEPGWEMTELEWRKAMAAAKRGDSLAMYNYYFKRGGVGDGLDKQNGEQAMDPSQDSLLRELMGEDGFIDGYGNREEGQQEAVTDEERELLLLEEQRQEDEDAEQEQRLMVAAAATADADGVRNTGANDTAPSTAAPSSACVSAPSSAARTPPDSADYPYFQSRPDSGNGGDEGDNEGGGGDEGGGDGVGIAHVEGGEDYTKGNSSAVDAPPSSVRLAFK